MTLSLNAPAGSAKDVPSLKEAFHGSFLIGAALNRAQFTEHNEAETALITKQFNTITAENELKWQRVHPQPDRYDFADGDRFVEFGEKNGMAVIGHTLVWHSQTPGWVFRDENGKPLTREALLKRMREHIHTVAGRYQGRIFGWDVVNEALEEDGTWRNSPWRQIIGDDYILKAFQFAHEADPRAELYYNDFALEKPAKRQGAVELVKKLQADGVELAGVGLQGHYQLDWPEISEIENTIAAFAGLGLKVMITELDVNVLPTPGQSGEADVGIHFSGSFGHDPKWNPYPNGLPREVERQLTDRYAELFKVFTKHRDRISRVTFWGVTDRTSWLNDWPIRGRTNYPLLFDRDGQTKPAFPAVVAISQSGE